MRLARTQRTLIAALLAPLALLTPPIAHATTTTAAAAAAGRLPVRHAPGDTVTLPVRDALAALTVTDEDRAGYSRDKFKHWTDADKTGCNTRRGPPGGSCHRPRSRRQVRTEWGKLVFAV